MDKSETVGGATYRYDHRKGWEAMKKVRKYLAPTGYDLLYY